MPHVELDKTRQISGTITCLCVELITLIWSSAGSQVQYIWRAIWIHHDLQPHSLLSSCACIGAWTPGQSTALASILSRGQGSPLSEAGM